MTTCPECKRRNLDKARICEKCGAILKPRVPAKNKKTPVTKRVIPKVKSNEPQKVIIIDLKIPFWSMVILMIKGVFASIPALVILALIGLLFISVASELGNLVKIFMENMNLL
ncbi:zinc ribbon domain-containing protein [Desulfococcaceae bacterium HSG8]|nr:zinc ribbon domain-containing protein [Desulfococcaceae bacterium HSG8]